MKKREGGGEIREREKQEPGDFPPLAFHGKNLEGFLDSWSRVVKAKGGWWLTSQRLSKDNMKESGEQGLVAHTCIPSTGDPEAGLCTK